VVWRWKRRASRHRWVGQGRASLAEVLTNRRLAAEARRRRDVAEDLVLILCVAFAPRRLRGQSGRVRGCVGGLRSEWVVWRWKRRARAGTVGSDRVERRSPRF